jgi:hypothetical protein
MRDGMSATDLARWCVFTNAAVAARGLDSICWTEDADLSGGRLLEPAAGDGAFVTIAAQRLVRSMRARGLAPNLEHLSDRILACEIHSGVADILRSRVARVLADEGLPSQVAAQVASVWCRTGDFLTGNERPGFTHVAGNPPFLRRGGSSADTCVTFFERSFRALAPGGRLAMIAPLSMASAIGAAGLRRTIDAEGVFEGVEILDPKDAFITHVSIISGLFVVRKVAAPTPAALRGRTSWLVGPGDACAAFERLSAALPKLEEAGCRVKLGMTTGANSVFVGRPDQLPVESELLIPAVEIGDMPQGNLAWRGQMVIATHRSDGSPWPSRARPALYRYLAQHRERLEGRVTVAKGGRSWRMTHSRLDHALAMAPKLLVPEIGRQPRVVMDPGGLMPLNSLHAITSGHWPLAALHALLATAAVGLAAIAINLRRGSKYLRLNATHLRCVRIPRWADVADRERELLLSGDPSLAADAAARLYKLEHALLRRCAAAGWEA